MAAIVLPITCCGFARKVGARRLVVPMMTQYKNVNILA
jgi:hypothetical protein